VKVRVLGALGVVSTLLAACATDGPGAGGLLVSVGAAATTGGSSGAGGDSAASPAQQAFVAEVFPAIAPSCVSCHGEGSVATQFLASDAEEAYATIRSFASIVTTPKQSRLLTKGKHAGPALTAAQAKVCTEWLELELVENLDSKPPTPVELTPQQELEAFGKCISKADWDATKVALLAKQTAKSQNNNVPCASCHGDGANGTFIDLDSTKMFEATRKLPYLFKFASASLEEDGTFKDIAFANRWVEKGAEGCPPLGNCHPEYLLDGPLVAAINELYTLTYERWKQGGCEAPEVKP
jgi:mono/diheme cytochrome c family protein